MHVGANRIAVEPVSDTVATLQVNGIAPCSRGVMGLTTSISRRGKGGNGRWLEMDRAEALSRALTPGRLSPKHHGRLSI
jgi:hypothetical protein